MYLIVLNLINYHKYTLISIFIDNLWLDDIGTSNK